MVGPAALAVALLLLPGWVYWRLEASPRTTRTALGEFFEVVAAGALATGATVLVYASLPNRLAGYKVGDLLTDPADLTGAYVRQHITRASWSIAVMVGFACAVAALAAWAQRRYRKHVGNDRSTYVPETPIWVQSMGNTDCVLTLDLRDGRRVTGYLRGHSVDDDGSPTVFLTPPLVVQKPASSGWRRGRKDSSSSPDRFPIHAITVPGSEIVAVWREFGDDD